MRTYTVSLSTGIYEIEAESWEAADNAAANLATALGAELLDVR